MSKRIDFVKGLKDLNETDLKARITGRSTAGEETSEFAHTISPLENPDEHP